LDSQDGGPIAQSEHLWTDRRREHEEEVKKKALELLAGYGDVQILVTSEPIGTESLNQTSHNNDQETQVSPQSPTTLPNRKARLQEPESPKTMLQQRFIYTNRISISVPISYYHKAYQRNGHANQQSSSAMQDNSAVPSLAVVTANPTSPTEQALENIKTSTARTIREKLFPLVATSSIGASEIENRIVITEHLDSIDSANNIQPTWQNLVDWLRESWKTLGLFAIVMIAMLLLKSIAPSPRVNEIVDLSKQASGLSLIDHQENPDSVQQDKPLAKSSVILSRKIQSHPEQVASRLASWISQN
jgi:hypothetical protein